MTVSISFGSCPRQLRDSNECGLHVIVNALAHKHHVVDWFSQRATSLKILREGRDPLLWLTETFLSGLTHSNSTLLERERATRVDQSWTNNPYASIALYPPRRRLESQPILNTLDRVGGAGPGSRPRAPYQSADTATLPPVPVMTDAELLHDSEYPSSIPLPERGSDTNDFDTWLHVQDAFLLRDWATERNLCFAYTALVFARYVYCCVIGSPPMSLALSQANIITVASRVHAGALEQCDASEALMLLLDSYEELSCVFLSYTNEPLPASPRWMVSLNRTSDQQIPTTHELLAAVRYDGDRQCTSNGIVSNQGHYTLTSVGNDACVILFARKVQPLKRSFVNSFLRSLRASDILQAHFIHKNEAGVWAGVVERGRDYGVPALINFDRCRCENCGDWMQFDNISIQLPFPKTAYLRLRKLDRLPSLACVCDCSEDGRTEDNIDGERTECLDHAQSNRNVKNDSRYEELFGNDRGREAALGIASGDVLRADVGRRWFVYKDKPPHVHTLVWRQMAVSTRKSHVRWLETIRGMPVDIALAPLSSALVDLVLRIANSRNWRWSTISTALSTISSALLHLPLYTNQVKAIDLRTDATFSAACKRAQHLARVTQRSNSAATALSYDTYQRLLHGVKNPRLALFLELCWHFASRVGDMRQVRQNDVQLGEKARGSHDIDAAITFRHGKGAAFWGPFTVHARLPLPIAKRLSDLVSVVPSEPLFSSALQTELASLLHNEGLDLRAIRRGALIHLARAGVSDSALQLLSGHKRRDTLLRYLGWGVYSSSARSAALDRASAACYNQPQQEVAVGGGVPVEPPKMGAYSGHVGDRGRRVSKPPPFIPLAPPSHKDLGLEVETSDSRDWPLHLKNVTTIVWSSIIAFAQNSKFRASVEQAAQWCTSSRFYGAVVKRCATEIPYSRLNSDQIRLLLNADKIQPHSGEIFGYVKGFLLQEPAKRRLRPIFEPYLNKTLCVDSLLPLQYPSRLERRSITLGARFQIEFDFAGFFDQFPLEHSVRNWFVFRVHKNHAVGGHQLFQLTRLPMGARFAPGVAQTITWLITCNVLGVPSTTVSTMIDNVRITGQEEGYFIKAVRKFLDACASLGVQINDFQKYQCTDQVLLQQSCKPLIFLGELYLGNGYICNADKNIQKLRLAYQRFCSFDQQKSTENYTIRNFAAFMGLCLFLIHTVNVPLYRFHAVLRAYSSIVRLAMTGNGTAACSWDKPMSYMAPSLKFKVEELVEHLLCNQAVPITSICPPSYDINSYDIVAIIDASKVGWGAFVLTVSDQVVMCLRQSWESEVLHSAAAEPKAVAHLMAWLLQEGLVSNRTLMALVTDHSAIAIGQRRWYSGFGGFSMSYHLNTAYSMLYENTRVTEIFYVQGSMNPADGPSRSPENNAFVFAEKVNFQFPSLRQFSHPYHDFDRPRYMV